MRFVRDKAKAAANIRKHGVAFEEAQTAFLDENARIIDDPDHSDQEERFILLGYSLQARCIMVSHCYRESELVIRLISARRATTKEERNYWRYQ